MGTYSEKIRTICGFCHTNCGLIASVQNGKITSIEADPKHPVNAGDICPKGLAGKQIVLIFSEYLFMFSVKNDSDEIHLSLICF